MTIEVNVNQEKSAASDIKSVSDNVFNFQAEFKGMFVNCNRILIGEHYQAVIPEFSLNKEQTG